MNFIRKNQVVVAAVALFVLLFAGWRLFRPVPNPHPEAISAYYADMTRQVQEVAAGLPKSTRVVILVYDAELRLASDKNFRRVYHNLKRNGQSVEAVERLVFDTDAGWKESLSGFPYQEYLRAVRDHPNADAVLSLCGLPYGCNGFEPGAGAGLPPLLITRVADEEQAAANRLLEQGWIQAVAINGGLGDGD